MALTAGTRLGPYEIVAPLGAGGMGEVYRARDTRLNRDVAIKVLPDVVAADPDRLARFEREAQALAALNHPNIAQIYGLETSGNTSAIVMELVAGEDLSARIRRGPVPLADALAIARQIADALAAAHETGIIHRDLKPANVKVRDDGTVKVLDFGLAKALAPEGTGEADAMNSPTLTARATQMGVILGTAAYMAPEQAKGKAADKRADVWAFGVVLYEMLTGRRPFAGDDVSETLAHVLTKDPDWATLPPATPARIRELLRRCLTRDVKQRLRDIADARLEIDDAIAPHADSDAAVSTQAAGVRSQDGWARRHPAALAAGAFLLGAAAVGATLWRAQTVTGPNVTYAQLDVGPAEELNSGIATVVVPTGGPRTALAWSPDGRTLAFVGRKDRVQVIYVRDLGRDIARPLDGTENAQNPVFSPDGQWIAFSDGKAIRKVAAAGGPPAKICNATEVNGITWGNTRMIYAGTRQLFQVPPGGGTPEPVTTPSPEEVRDMLPQLLPGDAGVLYTEHGKGWTSGDERVMVKRLPDGAPKELLREAADARYLPTRHILFLRQGTVFVAPFDSATFAVGDSTPVLTDVAQAVTARLSTDLTLASQLAVSSDGTLAYLASPLLSYPNSELVSVDRRGAVTALVAPAHAYLTGSQLSPDGSKLVVGVYSTKELRPFVYDINRHTLADLAPSGTREFVCKTWSATRGIACLVNDGGISQLTVLHPDDASPPNVVPDSADFWPTTWSRDGNRLAGARKSNLWVYSPDADPKLASVLATPATETHPAWSPDGQWLAYASNTSGRFEVWVRPYPGPGKDVLVSIDGGTNPAWNPNGKELFFTAPNPAAGDQDRVMMAVNMMDPLHPGKPETLFPYASTTLRLGCTPANCYAVSPDGQKFYATRWVPASARPPVTHINLIFNWVEAALGKAK